MDIPVEIFKRYLANFAAKVDFALKFFPTIGVLKPLKGFFSAYELLLHGHLRGEVIRPSQDTGIAVAGSLTSLAGMAQHHHQPWPIFWTMVEDARLVGKMLQWRNSSNQLCLEGCYRSYVRRSVREDRILAQFIVRKPLILEGAWTSVVSKWCDGNNYYHWMCDGLTRLMVQERLPEPTKILIPKTNQAYVAETLELLGLSDSIEVSPAHSVQPERFYFCSPTAMTGVWNPMGFDWLRNAFRKFYCEPKTGWPIFITRRGVKRVPPNILRIEKIFADSGFEIIDCADLTVKEQIQYLSAAPAVAGIHGAAMTNLLWAHPRTKVLEIFQPTYFNGCFEQIANQGNLDYDFLVLGDDSSHLNFDNWIKSIHR